jgi:hypothetical protein
MLASIDAQLGSKSGSRTPQNFRVIKSIMSNRLRIRPDDAVADERVQLSVTERGGEYYCRGCRRSERDPRYLFTTRYEVDIERIEQNGPTGWRLFGRAKKPRGVECQKCGEMLSFVHQSIPIECAEYDCPTCHKRETLTYRVNRIDTRKNDFTFEAEIVCKKCKTKHRFIEALGFLGRIKKIEIKLTGITIERR